MESFRNHPVVILKNSIAYLVLGFVLSEPLGVNLSLLLTMGLLMLTIVWWRRTLYNFDETEIHVVRDTLFKNDTHIQYAKLSTVDVHRNLVDRVFGTATLSFTINSSINSNTPEASLTLNQNLAIALRDELNTRIFNKDVSVEEDSKIQSEVKVSNVDIILHAIFGQSSFNVLWGFAFLVFSLVSAWNGNVDAFVSSIVMLIITSIIPWLSIIFRYCNYRIYRIEDTITIESGLISTYRTSFKVNKVNSVGIRESFFAKMMGRAILEAEVVGVADSSGRPILCPMKPKAEVDLLFRRIIPEFVMDEGPLVSQPHLAFVSMTVHNMIYALPLMIVGVLSYLYLDSSLVGSESNDMRWIFVLCELVLFFWITGLCRGSCFHGSKGTLLRYGG